MATITKDGYTYNTETKTRTSPTGKVVSIENMDAITPNLKADTPISLDSLNQTNQLSLPEAKPEVSPTYTLTPLEIFERDTQMRADASDRNYLDTQRAIGEAEARELDYQEELGASENLKAFKNYERQLQAEQLALRRYKEDISGETSMSEAMTNATINQEEARSLRKQADIAILGNMALGNYNEAIQTAKTKVEMELKPLTRQLDYYKTVMERNQDLLSTTQKSKLQSLYSDIERQKNKEEERLTKIESIKIEAIKNGFRGDFSGVQTIEEVARKAGNFLVTPLERLQMEKLKGDIAINASELALAKQTIQGTTGDPIADIIAGSSRFGDKRLTDSQLEKIQKSLSALGSMETLQGLLSQGKDGIDVSGPVKGRARTLVTQFGGDANASAINATIQGLIPTVARGIFGEVGVLTDADIANYRKTVPNLNATGEQNKLISLVMYDVLSRSLKNTLVSNARNQTNVSGFLSDYQDVESRINTLKSNLGVVEVAKIDPVNKAKMESAWSATNINNKVKSTLDSFFN